MFDHEREFVRKEPRPTEEDALNFCRSVMSSKGVDGDGPYKFADGMSLKNAHAALKEKAWDVSEKLAFEKAEYALEAADLTTAKMNSEATEFAMELLMPFDFIAADIPVDFDIESDHSTVKKLARKYEVSEQLMTVRIVQVLNETQVL